MSRLNARFSALKSAGKTALIPYISAGDPQPDVTVPTLHAMVNAGADVLEIGVPFSDPMADGPVIQAACERALKHNVSLRNVLDMVREFRQTDNDTPIVLMGYLNPIEVMGYETFADAAQSAGVDGVLTVDIPPEESEEFVKIMKTHQLAPIFLLAPTSTPERIERVCAAADGFVYYVSFKGVTGANALNVDQVANKLAEVRRVTDLPIGVGFGIRDGETARKVAGVADAVVVGSAIVSRMADLAKTPEQIPAAIASFVAELRNAIDTSK